MSEMPLMDTIATDPSSVAKKANSKRVALVAEVTKLLDDNNYDGLIDEFKEWKLKPDFHAISVRYLEPVTFEEIISANPDLVERVHLETVHTAIASRGQMVVLTIGSRSHLVHKDLAEKAISLRNTVKYGV
jgi:hypothetical protein